MSTITRRPRDLFRGVENRAALARFLAAGWALGTFSFYAFSSEMFRARSIRFNALDTTEWLRLWTFLALGMVATGAGAFVVLRRGEEAFLAASYRIFLLFPLGLLPLYPIANEPAFRFFTICAIAASFGWCGWLFGQRSPHRGELIALDGPAGSRVGTAVAVLLASANAFLIASITIERTLALEGGWDLMIHNSLHYNIVTTGRAWTTGLLSVPVDHYGNHFAPIEHLSAIVYSFHRAPETLVALQSVVICLGALPVFGVSRRLTGSTTVGLLLAASYSVNACTIAPCLYDFHEASFLIPTLLSLTWACVARRKALIILFAVLALGSREDAGLWVALFGAIWWSRGNRIGLWLMITGGVTLLLVNFAVMPFIRSTTGQPVWLTDRYGAMARGGQLGVGRTVVSMVTNPGFVVSYVISDPAKWHFLALVLLPVALLPLVAWRGALLIGPPIAFSVLSNFPPMYSIDFHYTVQILPFLYLATVFALERFERRKAVVLAATALAATTLVSGKFSHHPVTNGPLVEKELTAIRNEYGDRAAKYRAIARNVPRDGCAMGTHTLATPLSSRRDGYRFPDGLQCPYGFFDFGDRVWEPDEPYTQKARIWLLEHLRAGDYGVMFADDRVALVAKGRPTDQNPKVIERIEELQAKAAQRSE